MANSTDPVEPSRPSRFEAGDHLRVRRSSGYMHHGIYVNDNRIIQFGGRIGDKPHATICVASLDEFEQRGTAEVVQHGRHKHFFPILPTAQPGEKVVDRAEWLLANHPPGRYNIVGNNCEHMANWCTTGWYTESHQVRAGFGAVAAIGAVGVLYLASRARTSPMPAGWFIGLGAVELFGFGGAAFYNFHIRRFWRDLGQNWLAYERMQPQDEPPADT